MFAFTEHDLYKVLYAKEAVQLSRVASLPSACAAIACANANTFYLATIDEPTQLQCWNWQEQEVKVVATLPTPIITLLFCRNKIYGLLQGMSCFVIYDPLCSPIETVTLEYEPRHLTAVGDDLVLQDLHGTWYIYCMANGTSRPIEAAQFMSLLGVHRQLMIFTNTMSPAQGLRPRAITSSGTEVQLCLPADLDRFIEFDGGLMYIDRKAQRVRTSTNAESDRLSWDMARHLELHAIPTLQAEDVCLLCLCELDEGASLTLDCGHQFHIDCVEQWVRRWDEFCEKGQHVTFTRALCPAGCKRLIRHPRIRQSSEIQALSAAVATVTDDVLRSAEETRTAYDVLVYICHVCRKPFYGGDRVCVRMLSSEPTNDPQQLTCEDCATDFRCSEHSRQFVVYKCSYCCNPAVHRSFGTRYLCERCDTRWTTAVEPDCLPCPGEPCCPLGGQHTEGHSYPIGCLLCMPHDTVARLFDAIQPAGSE